jgi:hypothetical protein
MAALVRVGVQGKDAVGHHDGGLAGAAHGDVDGAYRPAGIGQQGGRVVVEVRLGLGGAGLALEAAVPAGLIAEFVRRWYGTDFQNQLRIVAEVDSIYYGLALLRSRLVHGALIATSAAAQAAIDGRLPGGPGLRLIRLVPGFTPPLQILAGIFARKNERSLYHQEHPLNLLWNAFEAHLHARARNP